MTEKNMRYTMSVKLYTEDKCFGPGIAELLRRVKAKHSLRSAAAEMGMAYSKAWRILRDTQAALGCELLNSHIGGANGGGAELTPEGESILASYDAFLQEVTCAADAAFIKHFGNKE